MAVELILVRHPPTQANLAGKVQGTTIDEGPAPGYEPALEALAETIYRGGKVDAIFTSELKRASIPAQLLLEMLIKRGHKPEYIPTSYVNERDFGIHSGLNYVVISVEKMHHDYLFAIPEIPDGESHKQIEERLRSFDLKYIQPMADKSMDGYVRAVVVAHLHLLNHMANFYLADRVNALPFRFVPNSGVMRILITPYERASSLSSKL